MKNKTLKFMCKILCLVLVASFVLEAPLMALETIPVSVGGQQFQVTPGQWVSVRQGTQIVHYNVRYVNGRPVALEMSQYVKLIFGEASTAAATAGASGNTANSGSSSSSNGSSGAGSASGSGAKSSGGSSVSSGGSGSSSSSSSSGGSAISTSGGDQAANNVRKLPQRDPVTGRFVKSDGSTSTTTNTNTSVSNTTNTTTTNTSTSNSATTNNTTANNTTSNTTTSGNSGSIVADNGGAAVAGDANVQTNASPKSNWDPAAHPRDPETGRFIKRESATTGSSQSGQSSTSDPVLPSDSDGLGLPGGDADGAGLPSGDAAGQTGQTGQTGDGTQAGQVGDGAQSGQVGQAGDGTQAGQSTDGKQSFKDKISGKFRSGYDTGKSLTNQGFQNVKDSLKSGFSAKNILVTAGITVGVDLATQIMRGEKPSAKKALKTVCSAEFAGGVVGSVTGAAAGSFFVPFLSAVPVVGGFLGALAPTFGSIVGGSVGSYLAGDLKNGKFSLKQAFKQIDWIGVAGQTVGSTVGAMLGSAIFPPFGTIIGGMVGGYVGNWAAHKIAGVFGKDNQNNGVVAMPTGSNPLGGDTSVNGSVTIGETSGTTSGSVAGNSDVLTIPGENTTGSIGTYESEVQLAYARYQELYNLYSELTKQGRQEDAKKIIVEMNAAKAQFDTLKAKGSK